MCAANRRRRDEAERGESSRGGTGRKGRRKIEGATGRETRKGGTKKKLPLGRRGAMHPYAQKKEDGAAVAHHSSRHLACWQGVKDRRSLDKDDGLLRASVRF